MPPRAGREPPKRAMRTGMGATSEAMEGSASNGVIKGGGARVKSTAPQVSGQRVVGPRLTEAQMQANFDAIC